MAIPVIGLLVIFPLAMNLGVLGDDTPFVHRLKNCIGKDYAFVCLKEEALDILNQTVMSHESFRLGGFIDIERDPEYVTNHLDEELPTEMDKRDEKLNELLYRKAEEYFESRSVRLHLANVVEGRGKKKGGGGGGGKMAVYAMMGTMMAYGMMTGKTAMMGVIALVIAKMAMMMCGASMMKKMSSGGETQHIVYTADLGGGGGGYGSGGGWGRSLIVPSNHEIVYRAHTPSPIYENQIRTIRH